MEPAARPRRPAAGLDQRGRAKNEPIGDGRVDPRQVLQNGATRAEVQVADLGVAHLPGRQANCVLDARSSAWGQRASSPRHTAIGAAAIASAAGSGPTPKPSSTTRTMGRGRVGRSPGVGVSTRRAFAVSAARATMPAISSGLSEAPPTSAPSIDGSAELADVRRRDAAAIEDREGIGQAAPTQCSEHAADGVGHRGRVGAAGVPARPDRPDWLVCNHLRPPAVEFVGRAMNAPAAGRRRTPRRHRSHPGSRALRAARRCRGSAAGHPRPPGRASPRSARRSRRDLDGARCGRR